MEKLNVEELFQCKNCTFMVDEPLESECCGILYCQACIHELSYTNCGNCKKLIKFRKNLFAKNLMKKVDFKCRHLCGGKFNYEDMKTHLLRCETKIYKCSIDYCYCVDKKKEMLDHSLLSHPNEILLFMENFEEFKTKIEKIKNNPIDNKNRKENKFNK